MHSEAINVAINRWAVDRYSFLVREFGFRLENPGAIWSLDYHSPIVTIWVCWYRDPGVGFMVQPSTYWIRPADPRTFGLLEVVQMVNPNETLDSNSTWEGEEGMKQYLEKCAIFLEIYARPILKGEISMCEDVLITRGLKRLEK